MSDTSSALTETSRQGITIDFLMDTSSYQIVNSSKIPYLTAIRMLEITQSFRNNIITENKGFQCILQAHQGSPQTIIIFRERLKRKQDMELLSMLRKTLKL